MNASPAQPPLFEHVAAAYAEGAGPLTNDELYRAVASRAGINPETLNACEPIGRAGALRSPTKRKIRWFQQTLKQIGVIERVKGERGLWRLTEPAGKELHKAAAGVKLVAYSTSLGVAVWAKAQDVFPALGEPIALGFTSLPYPLRQPRAYGNPSDAAFADFACEIFEPIVRQLVPGGSIVLNISNDIFEPKSPARSLYIERLILALHDRLGLHLMDRTPWINLSKPPGPTYWACVNRVQLTSAYEPIYSIGYGKCSVH